MNAEKVRNLSLYGFNGADDNAKHIVDCAEMIREAAAQLAELNANAPTLRDQMAMAAIAAIITRGDLDTQMDVTPYCQDAYVIADAMIAAGKVKP